MLFLFARTGCEMNNVKTHTSQPIQASFSGLGRDYFTASVTSWFSGITDLQCTVPISYFKLPNAISERTFEFSRPHRIGDRPTATIFLSFVVFEIFHRTRRYTTFYKNQSPGIGNQGLLCRKIFVLTKTLNDLTYAIKLECLGSDL